MKPASRREFDAVFAGLRAILKRQTSRLSVSADAPHRYCLEGEIGPATLRAWGGKAKRATIPVAWAEIGQTYVSFHIMGLQGVRHEMSRALQARMQGKACFNFATADEVLFEELEALTARAIAAFRKAGFCV